MTSTLATAPVPELAKKWLVEIDGAAAGATEADWKKLRGMTAFQSTLEFQEVDTTDFDSGPWKGAQYPTQIGWGITCTVMRKKYSDAAGPEDEAQAILRKAVLPDSVTGQPTLVHVRFYDRFGGPEAHEGWASVKWEPQSGGPTDAYNVQITLSGAGERLDITNPSAPSAWAATTAYTVGQKVTVTGGTLQCTTAGTSGSTEPTAPASVGGSVTDGTAVWTRIA